MEQPISHATVINLEHFPPYDIPGSKRSLVSHIARYLKKMFDATLPSSSNVCMALPSFSALCGFFRCTHLEIYDALKTLGSQGYDYQFSSLDETILVWRAIAR